MNRGLFASRLAAPADTTNEAGGAAYAMKPKAALAQLAVTGCFNDTFYATGESQVDQVLKIADQVDAEFIGKLAVYSRTKGYMKDMPAVLCALLAKKDVEVLKKVFPKVIDNGKMLRNFVQVIRSGLCGRRSFGTMPKALIREWLASHDANWLFRNSYGNQPSFADVIKMIHPKPTTKEHSALYAYLIGKEHSQEQLPILVKAFESFKAGNRTTPPDLPFPMIAGLDMKPETWAGIARNASWQSTRMNLNTFLRHGVLADAELVRLLAERLSSKEEVQRARCFPYQLLMAFKAVSEEMPFELTEALQDAMEHAVDNVPELPGDVYVCPDVSGSMTSPVTGFRRGATSAVRCVDVAGLFAAAVLRKNRRARAIPFDTQAYIAKVNTRDSVMSVAKFLAKLGGGGTACSLPLSWLNSESKHVDAVIYVSDNESWADRSTRVFRSLRNEPTAMATEWAKLKKRCPKAKLVCIDIQPYTNIQVTPQKDRLLVGGFSDRVFDVIASWLTQPQGEDHWVAQIEKQEV